MAKKCVLLSSYKDLDPVNIYDLKKKKKKNINNE